MLRFRSRSFAAVFVLPLPLLATLQQEPITLADVADPLLHAEIAQLGLYPEIEGGFSDAVLLDVPLRSCSPLHAELGSDGVSVRFTASIKASHPELVTFQVIQDDSMLVIPRDAYAGLADPQFCGFDEGLQLILPYCSASRSADGFRTYVHLQLGEGRRTRLVTWVFDDGRYLFRLEENAVL
ncbi:MAG: hypothetical protein IT229_08350 [Flavobacteriales bacterium]|nr:hypothetical protein [Flavobacteriales bacterium]